MCTILVLKRKEGQWVDIIHKSGDVLRIRAYRIREGIPSQLDLAFDDEDRNFDIQRPERKVRVDSDVEPELIQGVKADLLPSVVKAMHTPNEPARAFGTGLN